MEEAIITLLDEDGNQVDFEILDAIELEDMGQYLLLNPTEEDEEDLGYIIVKVVQGEDEEMIISLQDEDEINTVFEEFQKRWDEEDDDEDMEYGTYEDKE